VLLRGTCHAISVPHNTLWVGVVLTPANVAAQHEMERDTYHVYSTVYMMVCCCGPLLHMCSSVPQYSDLGGGGVVAGVVCAESCNGSAEWFGAATHAVGS